MSQAATDGWYLGDSRANSVIGLTLTGALALAAVGSLLAGRPVDAVLAGTAAALAVYPAVVGESPLRFVPWPVLALATAPHVVGTVDPGFFGLVVDGVGIAAIGMLAAATIQATTSVSMTPSFAVSFVVFLTLATAAVWTVLAAAAAAVLGTPFVGTNAELMSVFTAAALGGVIGGLVFRWLFRRRLRRSNGAGATGEVNST
ncbi:hypothetical protein [Halorarum halobium]|uniref:hypothetical protein n=1 Tax=Halorarum halobium TaxID=3075121 RepID=UPI0028B101E3|nr:hypothetical protein [Halobaculum sp. XH14]